MKILHLPFETRLFFALALSSILLLVAYWPISLLQAGPYTGFFLVWGLALWRRLYLADNSMSTLVALLVTMLVLTTLLRNSFYILIAVSVAGMNP